MIEVILDKGGICALIIILTFIQTRWFLSAHIQTLKENQEYMLKHLRAKALIPDRRKHNNHSKSRRQEDNL